MSTIKDGGPAFPDPGNPTNFTSSGMTLRDYFAAQFMARAQSVCEEQGGGWSMENAAQCSYAMADAMLKARDE